MISLKEYAFIKDIDIFSVNYTYSRELFKKRTLRTHRGTHSILFGIFNVLINLVRYVVFPGGITHPWKRKSFSHSVLFYIDTENQRSALEPLINSEMYDSAILLRDDLPLRKIYQISLLFVPYLARSYLKTTSYRRWTFNLILKNYFLTYGYYAYVNRLLYRLSPKLLVMSNDHNMMNRIFLDVAKQMNIRTVYVQHASISKFMPPMEFDYALLEGEDALHKYQSIGIRGTQIYLTGNIKAGEYYTKVNHNHVIDNIGICASKLDSLEDIRELSDNIRSLHSFDIWLRPHPGGDVEGMYELSREIGLGFSDPYKEVSFEFLSCLDSIVVSSSNIILEAALLNVYPVIYQPHVEKFTNPYGNFIEKLRLQTFNNLDDLDKFLLKIKDEKPDIREYTSYFDASVGTNNEGNAQKLAQKILYNIVEDHPIKPMNRKSDVGMTVHS